MRVAINAIPLLTPLTGIGQYTLQLARELQRLLPEQPWLFYASDWDRAIRPAPVADRPGALAAIKARVPFGYEAARFLQQRRFSAGVREHGITLYHEPNYLALDFGGPTVVTVHDLSWVRHPEAHPSERVRAMNSAMPRVLERATRIIADSEFTRGEIISHYGVAPERVKTVLLGITGDFRPLDAMACEAFLASRGLRFGEYVLAVGTLEPRKNLSAAIEAHGLLPDALRRRYPLAVAGMRGWGDSRPSRADVRLLGYVPQESLPMLYSGARAFVYPSIYEGFGLPPLEALACGVPAVVSNRASLPEVVGEAAVPVDPVDAAALRDALRSALEDDVLRARLAAAGPRRAAAFTWTACAERTAAVYLEAMRASR